MRRSRFLDAILPITLLAVLPIGVAAQSNDGSKPKDDSKSDSGNAAKVIQNLNADVVAARKATAEKRYADAEALMLKVTAVKPELLVPRLELALAQLGLKKYSEAEINFKMVLGIDPKSEKMAHSDDFYRPDAPQVTQNSRNTMGGEVISGQSRTAEIAGVSYGSLGEIYLRTNRIPEAQAAFDSAVKANPSQAALYLRNETIFFFQIGNADAQLAAAEKAISVDPNRAMLYYFKGQALASKATVDPQTQKMTLPPGCAEAYRKYLELEPGGQFSADAKSLLAAAGVPIPARTGKS